MCWLIQLHSVPFCLLNSPWDQYEGSWSLFIKSPFLKQNPSTPLESNPLKWLVRSSGLAFSLLLIFQAGWGGGFNASRLVQLCCSPSPVLGCRALQECIRTRGLAADAVLQGRKLPSSSLLFPAFPTLPSLSPQLSLPVIPPRRNWGLCGEGPKDEGEMGYCSFKSAVVPELFSFKWSAKRQPQPGIPLSMLVLSNPELPEGLGGLQPQLTCLYL